MSKIVAIVLSLVLLFQLTVFVYAIEESQSTQYCESIVKVEEFDKQQANEKVASQEGQNKVDEEVIINTNGLSYEAQGKQGLEPCSPIAQVEEINKKQSNEGPIVQNETSKVDQEVTINTNNQVKKKRTFGEKCAVFFSKINVWIAKFMNSEVGKFIYTVASLLIGIAAIKGAIDTFKKKKDDGNQGGAPKVKRARRGVQAPANAPVNNAPANNAPANIV